MKSAAVKNTSFQGSFLFVNHDAKNLDARPHRQDVFTHVQSQYRRWNRQERTKALLASAKVSPVRRRQLDSISDSKDSAENKDRARANMIGYDQEDLEQIILVPHHSPTILLKGNSDPFNTHSVPIDPQVNELIAFFRDLVIPSIYHTGPNGWQTSRTANLHWQSAVSGLDDEGGALGFLARYAHVAAITNKDDRMATQALKYSSKSTSVLRERLEDSTALVQKASPLSQRVYWQINMLWGTEILSRHFGAAVLHGRMLKNLLEKQAGSGMLDTTFLRYVLYNDSHLICSYMVPSVFDYDLWVPEQYKVMEKMVMVEMPDLSPVRAAPIDPSVGSQFLRQIFIIRREHVEIWKLRASPEGISPLMYAWLATVNSIHQGQLIKHALDAMDMAEKVLSTGQLWAEAYLSLASLYWIRSIGGSMIIRGVDIYDSQRPMLQMLRKALTRAEELQTPENEVKYRNARLWALFIGAQAEQSWRRPGWFTNRLAVLGQKMELMTFSSVKEILAEFLYTDMLPPHGRTWYEAVSNQAVR